MVLQYYIMDVIKEDNNSSATESPSYSTPCSMSSVTLTSMSSVIHSNQPSVIQTASPTITYSSLQKNNVILVGGKLTSVIQPPNAIIHPLQVANSKSDVDDSLSADEETKKRREKLIRRPSYRKILHDIRQAEFGCGKIESSGSDCDSNIDNEVSAPSIPVSAHYPTAAVVPGGHLQLSSHCGNVQRLPTMMTNSLTGSGSLLQYSNQDGSYYVPNDLVGSNPGGVGINSIVSEDQVKKRELRLQKNREAARECRRKKKEYIKCLENRVAVLENQNKALIDELKSLKELYCQHKPEPQ